MKKLRKSSTFLPTDNNYNKNIILLPYAPAIIKGIDKSLRKQGFKVIYQTGTKLGRALDNPKDKMENLEKAGFTKPRAVIAIRAILDKRTDPSQNDSKNSEFKIWKI